MPYFERPKPPHDWRWWVGLLGRALITTGILLFGFVAYQLWGTGIQTAQAQQDLDSQFEQLLDNTTTSTSTTVAVTTETTDGTTTSTSTTIPVAEPLGVEEGNAVARLRIEKIGLDWKVVEGVGVPDLKKGPGHFPETPMPGQYGNAAVAGHRTTYGHPFLRLDELQPGDRIRVDTVAGTFVYAVTEKLVVNPNEYGSVIPTVDPTKATLTLATCTPAYTAKQRLIVKSELVAEESGQVLQPPSVTAPTDTTLPPDTTLPSETTDGTTASTSPDTTTPPDTTAVPTTDPAATDAFSNGWFHDTSAILPSILFALLLVAVTVGAYVVGRRVKRLWVCWLVGVLPFLVVLYFFYENVNRLLPPGI